MYDYKEPKAMEEIHKIRIKFYEEDKNLSIYEKIKKTNEIAKRILQEHGLNNDLVRN